MSLNAIWAELALNTKPFKEGLSGAQTLVQQFGRRIAGDLRQAFFGALSPERWLASTVSAVAKSMADISAITAKAEAAQVQFGAPDIPLDEMARMVALAGQLNLELKDMVELYKQGGGAFRTALSGMPSVETLKPGQEAIQMGLSSFSKDMTSAPSGMLEGGVKMLSRYKTNPIERHIAPWLQPLFDLVRGAIVEPGELMKGSKDEILKQLKDKKEAEELYKQQSDAFDRIFTAKAEAKKEYDEAIQKQLLIRGMETGRGSELREIALRNRQNIGSAGLGATRETGGLASIGGFTAGAGLSAMTVASQQTRLLDVIAKNTAEMVQINKESAQRRADVNQETANLEWDYFTSDW